MKKDIKYSEPASYFPKEIRDKFDKKSSDKNTSQKKTKTPENKKNKK